MRRFWLLSLFVSALLPTRVVAAQAPYDDAPAQPAPSAAPSPPSAPPAPPAEPEPPVFASSGDSGDSGDSVVVENTEGSAIFKDDSSASGPQWEKTIRIESDLRFRLNTVGFDSQFVNQSLVAGIERNQNILSTKLGVAWENFRAVSQIDLVLFGYQNQIQGIEALSAAEELQPYRIDIFELYVQVKDLLVKGFDFRVGQQVVQWGVGDQFNPTNNLNPDDIIDPLLFGRQQGNFMVRGDFWVTKDFSLQGVLVPLFKAARLPPSARLGVLAIDRLPFLDESLRYRIGTERAAALALANTPTVVDKVTIQQPESSFENMQAGFRMAGSLGEQDWSLSYYNGRTDFPQPLANHTRQVTTPSCHPTTGECSDGTLLTDITLHYPKMHVYGLNLAGEFNPFKLFDGSSELGGIGYRLEGALVVPQQARMKVTADEINIGGFVVPAGEYDYDGDGRPGARQQPLVVEDDPFLKWTLGLDYTFGTSGFYMNAMWVHGLADEYGAGDWMGGTKVVRASSSVDDEGAIVLCAVGQDGSNCANEIRRPRLGDFVVLGFDYKFLDDQALARLFTILEVSGYETSTIVDGQRVTESVPFYKPEGFSMVVFPEFNYNFGNGLELGAGALINIGKPYTKFGDPAAGGSVGFMRARYTL
jgi:hypothetical protein